MEMVKISIGRKCLQYIGALLAISLAIEGLLVALTASIKINSQQKLTWAGKFIRSFLQDLLLNPLLLLVLDYIVVRHVVNNNKVPSKNSVVCSKFY